MQEYIVKAYSNKLNETQREINLMSRHPSTAPEAQRFADSFASRLNQQGFLATQDWVGQVELIGARHARTE
jgi:hypothetical protein